MIIWAVRNGGRRFLSFPYTYHFSTKTAIVQPNTNFLVDYLTTKLGFSLQEAVHAAAKVTPPVTPRRNPDLVVRYLEDLGLNNSDIKRTLLCAPYLIFYDVQKTLQPKISVLQDLGLSRSDIIQVLRGYRSFLRRGSNSEIKPPIEYLRNLLGSDEKVVRVIKKYSGVFHPNVPKVTAANVVLLQKAGFSKEEISRFILEIPRPVIRTSAALFKEMIQKAEHDFGISPKSNMFYYVLLKLMSTSKLRQAKTFEVLRSFGWSDSMIYLMMGKHPGLLGLAEDSLVKKLNFFMGELGYSIEYLASHPKFLSFSLEKRVKPRFEVLRVLHEKKLCKGFCLYTVVCIQESRFIDEFLVPFRTEIHDVYESYFSTVGKKH